MKKLLLVLSIAIMLSGCAITDFGRGVVGAGMMAFGPEPKSRPLTKEERATHLAYCSEGVPKGVQSSATQENYCNWLIRDIEDNREWFY